MEAMKMKMDGTIRAKVIQYKRDGNTLTEKWHTLTRFAEGIYFSYTEPDRYGHRSVNIIFSKNGIFWRIGGEPEHYFNPDSFRYAENMETIKKRYANYEADILQAAANGEWLNKLHITVMERLGHDVAPLLVAYEERKRKWEENERKRIEAAEKAEQERKQAEERRKAELLAEGKEKLMANKAVTVEQIELLAEAVGYKIHIRTIGFMREKVSEAVLNTDETVTVWGRKLTQRNISGTADVLREIAARIKAQAEQEAQQSATPTETPQISTETAEPENVSTESEIHEISRLIALYGFGFSTAPDNGNLWRLYSNSEPITDYMTIRQLLEWLRAYSRKQDTSSKPKSSIFAPQSTQTAKAIKCTTRTRKRRQRARKRQNSAFRHFRTTRRYTLRNTLRPVTYVPQQHSTANSPPTGSPPRTLSTGSTKRIYY